MADQFEQNFTHHMLRLLQTAQTEAQANGHQVLHGEHILLAMLDDPERVTEAVLHQVGVDPILVKQRLDARIGKLPKVTGGDGKIYLDQQLGLVLNRAMAIAKKEKLPKADLYCVLQAMLARSAADKTQPATPIGKFLQDCGLDHNRLNEVIEKMSKVNPVNDEAEAEKQAEGDLKKFTIDMTEQAKNGKLDPIIGREEEIRRTMQVLSRRTKNNPVLIGEPGVGKTAIAEGMAQRIIKGDVPDALKGKKILALDVAGLVAGTQFRGMFEERLKNIIREIEKSNGQYILFIDEMHMLMGAGNGGAGSNMDAANMLKPALARGTLHCIGATTLDEFQKHIEKDAAMSRRFQKVYVPEPSVEDTISILRGLKEKYEVHHGIRITDSAIVAAAKLSNRYITDRFLPDKAIDLIDEAASRLKMEADSKPEALDEVDRRIQQLRIEREALKKEKDKASVQRLDDLEADLANLEQKSAELNQAWRGEKGKMDEIRNAKEQLDHMRQEVESATREGNWPRVGELVHKEIPALEQKVTELSQRAEGMIKEEVKEADIASVVSKWTGIPVARMLEGEREKLLNMENLLAERVVGQEAAIKAVSKAVKRARTGLKDPNRPMGSFLFLGPTGVGKTELTKALAEFLFDDQNAIVRLDMSEFMEKHSVARLIGAPPGYVGYEEGGVLTEAVRRRPYQIVLLDEVEKAHPDVFNVLLQVLDDGRLTDGQGHIVDFKNTLVIMTSNLGAEHLANQEDGADVEDVRQHVMDAVRRNFRPEFINRIDEILLFRRLGRAQIENIVSIQLRNVEKLLVEQDISMELDAAATKYLAQKGYDPVYGARPLRRVIQSDIIDRLADLKLEGVLDEGAHVQIGLDKDQTLSFAISKKTPSEKSKTKAVK